jgi:hypothetical protein
MKCKEHLNPYSHVKDKKNCRVGELNSFFSPFFKSLKGLDNSEICKINNTDPSLAVNYSQNDTIHLLAVNLVRIQTPLIHVKVVSNGV